MLDTDVSPDKAMPLGLIVNEFVTNSLKYAFDRNGGKISVRGKPLADDWMSLVMIDNGKGLQAASAAPSGSGSDMKIIHALAATRSANRLVLGGRRCAWFGVFREMRASRSRSGATFGKRHASRLPNRLTQPGGHSMVPVPCDGLDILGSHVKLGFRPIEKSGPVAIS